MKQLSSDASIPSIRVCQNVEHSKTPKLWHLVAPSQGRMTLDIVSLGQHSKMVSILASSHSCPRFDSQHSQKNFRGKKSMLPRSINGAAKRKVNCGLKMQIEPIQCLLLESKYYKKLQLHLDSLSPLTRLIQALVVQPRPMNSIDD